MAADDDLVEVYISQGPLAAEVARSKLVAEGILAMLRYQSVGRVLGITVDGLGKVAVLVNAEDAERAREVLAEEEATGDEPQPPTA